MSIEREELIEKLKSGVVTVKFTKANGEERILKGTLQESYLPPRDPSKPASTKAPNLDNVSMWSVEDAGWRSVKLENIISVD